MGYLDKLKEICSKMQETSQTKDEIDRVAEIQTVITGLEAEEAQTLKNYTELKESYKEAVLHNSYSQDKPKNDIDNTKNISFESMLEEFVKNNNK